MKRVKVKETERATYITALFDADRIPHQATITVYPNYIHCEIVPPSVAAKELVKKLAKVLGEPVESPRIRESMSDCGEEAGALFTSWKGKGTEKVKEILRLFEEEGFKI